MQYFFSPSCKITKPINNSVTVLCSKTVITDGQITPSNISATERLKYQQQMHLRELFI